MLFNRRLTFASSTDRYALPCWYIFLLGTGCSCRAIRQTPRNGHHRVSETYTAAGQTSATASRGVDAARPGATKTGSEWQSPCAGNRAPGQTAATVSTVIDTARPVATETVHRAIPRHWNGSHRVPETVHRVKPRPLCQQQGQRVFHRTWQSPCAGNRAPGQM